MTPRAQWEKASHNHHYDIAGRNLKYQKAFEEKAEILYIADINIPITCMSQKHIACMGNNCVAIVIFCWAIIGF